MHIKLPYGSEQVPVDVPDNWINGRCYRPHPLTSCTDARAELLSALASIGPDHQLSRLAEGKESCVIAVDTESPELLRELLPALVEEIEDEAEIAPAGITVLVANNPLQPITDDALPRIIPPEIHQHYRVLLHHPGEHADLEYLNRSPASGIPLIVNKHYLEAGLKVILSGVRPHMVFGFSGGRSVLAQGLSGSETLQALFSLENINNENARYGNFRDNPFHLFGMELVNAVGCDLAVSATLSPLGKVCRVFAGPHIKAQIQAMNSQRGEMLVSVKEPMDIVVTSGGGAPLDASLVNVLETISGVVPVLKPGGTIVVSAALSNGFGPPNLTRFLRNHASVGDAIDSLSDGAELFETKWIALRLYRLLQDHEIILFNRDISEDQIWSIGFTPARNLNEAVQEAMTGHGQGCKIVAFPDGPSGLSVVGAG